MPALHVHTGCPRVTTARCTAARWGVRPRPSRPSATRRPCSRRPSRPHASWPRPDAVRYPLHTLMLHALGHRHRSTLNTLIHGAIVGPPPFCPPAVCSCYAMRTPSKGHAALRLMRIPYRSPALLLCRPVSIVLQRRPTTRAAAGATCTTRAPTSTASPPTPTPSR
jgi:hypothetical protein